MTLTLTLGWMDGVRSPGLQRDDGGGCSTCAKYRKEWRALVRTLMIEFNAVIFAGTFFSDRAPAPVWLVTSRGVGCRYMMRLWQTKKGVTTEYQGADALYMG